MAGRLLGLRVAVVSLTAALIACGGPSDPDPGPRATPGAEFSEGVASCVDEPADVQASISGSTFMPAGPETPVDLVGAEISIRGTDLGVRWLARHDVYITGDAGPLVQHHAGPLTAVVGPYAIWAYPPAGGTDVMLVRRDRVVEDPEGAEIATSATIARDGPVVEVVVPLDELPELTAEFDWGISASAALVGASGALTMDACGLSETGVPQLRFPGDPPERVPTTSIPEEAAAAGRVTPQFHTSELLGAWLGGDLAAWEDRVVPDVMTSLEEMGGDQMADWCGGAMSMCTVDTIDCSEDTSGATCDFTIATEHGGLMGTVGMSTDPVGEQLGGDYWAVYSVDFFVE